ncbi:MAG: hypothetical protein NZL95_00420 [Chitinophagales bacterium]|nr:hypothetical protein [Chitinophagales bacterium]MDW8427002.1 hypothetical protein [Chitinophagales bacterium]
MYLLFVRLMLLVFVCNLPFAVLAQQPPRKIEISESTFSIDKAEHKGLDVIIPYADKKVVEKELMQFMQKRFNAKGSSKKGIMTFNNVSIGQLSARPVDVLAQVLDANEGTRLQIAFITSEGNVSSERNQEQYYVASGLVREFGRNQTMLALNERLASAQKQVDAKQRELDNLVKEKSSLEKTIRDCQETISKAESDLKKNAENQERVNRELEQQRANVQSIRDLIGGIE